MNEKQKRDLRIVSRVASGEPVTKVARDFHLSQQRVSQIAKRGVTLLPEDYPCDRCERIVRGRWKDARFRNRARKPGRTLPTVFVFCSEGCKQAFIAKHSRFRSAASVGS